MGAGASAAQQIKDASPEELKAVLDKLPSDRRAAIEAALGKGKSPESGFAPYLKQAFDVVAKQFKKSFEDGINGVDMDPDKIQAEMDATLAECRVLLEKSFDHHDTKGTGVLDKEEAAVFFKNLVGANGALMDHIVEISIKGGMDNMIKRVKESPSEEIDEETKASMVAEMKQQIHDVVADAKKNTAASLEAYKANADELNIAAFKTVDVNGDGTLQKEEFLDAMKFGSEKNEKFLAALGIEM